MSEGNGSNINKFVMGGRVGEVLSFRIFSVIP